MAIRRKKGFTAKQTRRMSRRMNGSTIGTHVQRKSPRPAGRHANASSVQFSDARAGGKASRGEVEAIRPSTETGETGHAHRHRLKQRRQIEDIQRKSRHRNIGVFVVVILIAVAIAATVGFMTFRGVVGSELSLKNSNATEALVAPEAGKASYTLIAVDLGAVAQPLARSGPDVMLLARTDAEARTIALVNVPVDIQVSYGENAGSFLYESANAGDAALVETVSTYTGVPISHLVKVSESGLAGLVDALGGIEVEVEQVVDDPHAGDVYIPTGTHTLNGQTAITYLRATNLKQGVQDQMAHQLKFATLLLNKIFAPGDGPGGFETRIESIDTFFQTDLTLGDLSAMNEWLSGIAPADMQQVVVPGYTSATTGVVEGEQSYYVASSSDVAALFTALDNGESPKAAEEAEQAAVIKSDFTIEVQNGTTITGAASVTGDALTQLGFTVKSVGNAEQPVYDETLVIYREDKDAASAQAVVNALGMGRTVAAGYYYNLSTDVLVILGADYKPTA